MKQLLPLLILSLLISCNNPNPNHYKVLPDGTIQQPELISEDYTTSRDSMLRQCTELKGLGRFEIGKTTYREILQAFNLIDLNNSFLGDSQWGSENFDEARAIQENPNIKQLEIQSYKIGSIEFSKIYFAFHKGILVGIDFKPIEELQETIIKHYISKYGNGDGHKKIENYYYEYTTRDSYYQDIQHTWYNEHVQLQCHLHYSLDPERSVFDREKRNELFLITDKTGKYDQFLTELTNSKQKFQEENNLSNSLEML